MNAYLTFKALHLIAVISWMAGLLYLPRIFVYHAETKGNNESSNGFVLGFWIAFNPLSRICQPSTILDAS